MAISLDTQVKELGPLGRRCGKSLLGLGITTARDLLWHLPFRYEDLGAVGSLGEPTSEVRTYRVRIDMIKTRRSPRKKMLLTEAVVSDDAGTAKAVWFRQSFITKLLKQGDFVWLSGRLEEKPWGLEMVSPAYEKDIGRAPIHTARLTPVYPLTGTITVKQIRALLHSILPMADELEETLDDETRARYGLVGLPEAVRDIHFPDSKEEAETADRRLRFEELFRFQLRGAWARKSLDERAAPVISADESELRAFTDNLPFTLTDDQRKVAWRILLDMSGGVAMQRLVEGDVGSGKTVVAALAMYACARAGYRSLLMAPTEILAEQHYRTISGLVGGDIDVSLRTRSRKIGTPKAMITIGTHALLSDELKFRNVGLVVVDEQHRFGVTQRKKLNDCMPHFLSMTATPIPRSLALALFGEVDFSQLRQMPKGRKPVRTDRITESGRNKMYETAKGEIAKGHKIFIVCPLIEPSDSLGVRSVQEEFERLRWEAFPETEIGLLHGKLKADEKQAAMERFAKGNLSVLVSTTVVEVGVDVPEATVMIIEGAERFGLAQLHQLRGRVGRSDRPSVCFLATSNNSPKVRERLEGFIRAKDCFELSELDLKLRGPGSIFGENQSGFGDLKRFHPGDITLIQETKEAAEELLKKDPHLDAHPFLSEVIVSEAEKIHLE